MHVSLGDMCIYNGICMYVCTVHQTDNMNTNRGGGSACTSQ